MSIFLLINRLFLCWVILILGYVFSALVPNYTSGDLAIGFIDKGQWIFILSGVYAAYSFSLWLFFKNKSFINSSHFKLTDGAITLFVVLFVSFISIYTNMSI